MSDAVDISSQFQSIPLLGKRSFGWVFVADWVLVLVLVIFVLFFFNRLVGSLISLSWRWYVWRKHRVRIKVQSVQLSLLGGRIFFKNLIYVGSNETITITQGNFTWRYWLHRFRFSKLDVLDPDSNRDKQTGPDIPSRVSLELHGLEWFVYNRSGAYDVLLQAYENGTKQEDILQEPKATKSDTSEWSSEGLSGASGTSGTSQTSEPAVDRVSVNVTDSKVELDQSDHPVSSASNPVDILLSSISPTEKTLFQKLLPIEIDCNKGAMVIGNKHTPSLLVLHFQSGTASVDASPSKNPSDLYKMLYTGHLIRPVLLLKPNIDYEGPDVEHFKRRPPPRKKHRWLRNFFKVMLWRAPRPHGASSDGYQANHHRSYSPSNENTNENETSSTNAAWKGLSRYLFAESESKTTSNEYVVEEYGKYSTILDASEGSISLGYDMPGKVPENPVKTLPSDGPDIGNGGTPPEWGVDMTFKDATIHFGPWADRQRVPLQSVLYPRLCVNGLPEPPRAPGQDRLYTLFKLFIQFEGDTILRIPIREVSKNSHVQDQQEKNDAASSSQFVRPFGWIELKARGEDDSQLDAAKYTTISWDSAMVATSEGYKNELRVDVRSPELRSSVNHGLLFSASSHSIIGDLSNPLEWNGLQNWKFSNRSTDVSTFFLREHVTLLSDLLTDFSSGPAIPYDLFTPYNFDVSWEIFSYAVYINVNDANIINNPSDFEDNTFVSFQGDRLSIDLNIPLQQVVNRNNTIGFNINVRCLRYFFLFLHLLTRPPDSTLS